MDRLAAVAIGVNQQMLTENVDDARDPARDPVNQRECVGFENFGIAGARDTQSAVDILGGLLRRQRHRVTTQRDSLPELPQRWPRDQVREFRLSAEHNL